MNEAIKNKVKSEEFKKIVSDKLWNDGVRLSDFSPEHQKKLISGYAAIELAK